MSKVTMPEPVAQQIRYFDSNALSRAYGEWSEWKMFTGKYERMGMNQKRALITTTQAEAYADARAREALEKAAQICWEMQSSPEFGKDDKDHWLAIAERRIRALLPPTE